jgi:glutamyl/glutaminyl-tRNA synthetase
MAERLSEVQARLESHHELQEIVGAMRAIAAARLQEAQEALEGTRAYAQVVGDALAEALALLPEGPLGPESWSEWTGAVKAATGRKGRGLFRPLRLALTGRETGPEMAEVLPLLQRRPAI